MSALSGFMNAPVTKGTCLLVLGASVLTSALKKQARIDLRLAQVYRGEVWRLITSQLAFQDHGQTFSSLILLYTFRQFERQMGSRKFSSFLVLTSALALSFEMVASAVFDITPAPGPYGAIYSLFVLFYASVPKLHPRLLGIFGVDFSDKSLYYVIGLQLLLCRKWESALPAVCGLLAGMLWRAEALPLHRFRIPQVICKCFAILGPILNPRRQRRPRGPNAQNGQNQRGEQLIPGNFQGAFANPAARMAPEPPPEEAVQTLMGLGFERGQVIRALQASGNNVEMAANRLLSGS